MKFLIILLRRLIILYLIYGIISFEAIRKALILAPFMIIGLVGGMLSARVIDDRIVKRIVIVMLIISGIALILSNVA